MAVHGRFLKAAAAASMVAMVSAACTNGGGGESDEQTEAGTSGVGPITFAMGSNDTDKLRPVIDQWNAENPDQEVTLRELPAEQDGQRDTLTQSLQTESGEYDVFALDVTDTAYFAANGWLQPIEGDTEIDTSGLIEAAVDSATYNGTLYGIPQNTNAQLLYYRTDLQPEAPADWDALVASCEAAEGADVDCLQTQLSLYEGLTVAATQFIHSWGGQVVGDDGQTPELDTDQARAGLTALVDAYQNGVIPPQTDAFTEEETAQGFLAGETMYSYNWPYMYESGQSDPTSQVQGRFEVAPIVGQDGAGRSTLGGYNNAINVFSENKATAQAFLEYIISEDVQMSFAEQSFPPVLSSIYDDEALQQQFPYMPALKAALENAEPRPVTPYYPAVSKAIQDNTFAALRGEKSVEQALTDMSAAIDQAAQ
ncbi:MULTISPECIES: ABC transporter substrate-binding protein [unclassified Dietzia]|uniref:ABC transporter substrate-binding protein n=1 Tax=unclassified Dietzia TaxID=2617939 RepID=UPI000D228258|nr:MULTISPECIES: ABC transporter substrate-binding protein [unclassified Dietzia]AVZ40885.1 ABC transporter substrate-binding protein [Dietzia sp. JS16-p6b]MBB1024228.1 ABC transporter substrate-binding protein [Dietzia sp. DQ12-76]MBB1026713.1 ABC transporter substrate-binding protein [Dietzia sp. DQ11-38-2]QGW26515.1 ABC transporter substrate binding lipoprotein [Dietzia sp. DQ12-45-1b]